MKNDERILALKEQIKNKKEEIGKIKRFSPITNCLLELDGNKYNIQVLDKSQLNQTMIKLNSYLLSAKDLQIENECVFGGYNVVEWIEDIKSRLAILSQREEESKLKYLESKLANMLSDEKKTELEIDEIENLLK